MDKASEAILALNPVSFRYKSHKDTTPQFGLIAEEVAEATQTLAGTRRKRRDLHCALRCRERDAAQRVSEGAPKKAEQDRKIKNKQTMIADQKNEIEAVIVHAKEQDANPPKSE